MFSLISSLVSYFSQKIETLVVCGCLLFGCVTIRRIFRRKPTWQTLPADILEMIVQRLTIGDRIRVSNVSKTWRSVAMRRDIPSAPHQLPWLVIPQSSNHYLSFFDLSDGKVGKVELPESVRGGWFLGSCKGWFVIVKEEDLNSMMFLVNPISGAQHQLPPLSTIPSFKKYIETTEWKCAGGLAFCNGIALSTSDVTSCTVAASFDGDDKTLCFCRPGDDAWSIFEVLDTNDAFTDLLFSSGVLYALVLSDNKNGIAASPRTLSFRDRAVELKLVYDTVANYTVGFEEYVDYQIDLSDSFKSHLLESSTNNEVFVIHEITDVFLKKDDAHDNHEDGPDEEVLDDNNDNGNEEDNQDAPDEEEDDNNDDGNEEDNNLEGNFQIHGADEEYSDLFPYLRTSGFEVYKLDPANDRIVPVECLKDQLLFLSNTGSLSLPARDIKGLLGNSIYFATNRIMSFHSKTYICREMGEFYFNKGRIKRSFPSVEMSLRSQVSWFSPSL
ncbi:putative F-box domain-containing protein [Rosa chinensis]|uniref:Putative F-box domain-containing protein n=1 Tax=Rosa chinensis TaxID=74649 RepID=A0A2P6QPN0_ROSCH|nr:putative F-box domain-containing protein [Rosa chinensis]